MKVLAIGNSFSQDATRYLHQIAKADGVELQVVNLYIGGCSLEKHHYNITNDLSAYAYELNGESTGEMISVKNALLSDVWDVVTMQQVSHFSTNYETYQPYMEELFSYIKTYAPQAKQMIHQTWAYEDGSDRLTKEMGYTVSGEMFEDLAKAYQNAAKDLGGLQIIPSGRAFQMALEKGLEKLHRDTFHASFGLGRYILAGVWYMILTGNSIESNSFCEFDEPVHEMDRTLAKRCICNAVYEYTGQQDIRYAEFEPCKLDLHIPKKNSFPVLIYFHGGGLEGGDKSDSSNAMSELVDNGCAVVSANYRMYPGAKYPDFIEDAAQTVAWVKQNISQYGNCENIYVCGSSAGAYLAMMLCFDESYLENVGVKLEDMSGFLFDGGQPTTHFNVLKEKGFDTRSIIVDEASPLYHVCEKPNMPYISILVAEHDIPGRLKQTVVLFDTLLQFGFDLSQTKMKVMEGFGHCEYDNVLMGMCHNILAQEILEMIRRTR